MKTIDKDSLNKKLEQLKDVVLFPEKLQKANEILSQVGLPKDLEK